MNDVNVKENGSTNVNGIRRKLFILNFSLDTLPQIIIIHLWHVPAGHIDKDNEGECNEDVAG